MRSTIVAAVAGLTLVASSLAAAQASHSAPFALDQVRSYPFPNELAAAATGSRVAWAFNEQGRRNIFVAEGPVFSARQLTHYDRDDGQELSSVTVSANGRWVVFVRGGDHGSNWDDGLPVNVGSNPTAPKVQIFSVPFDGGDPKPIADGDEPVVSPRSDVVAFVKGGQIWTAPIDGSAPAKALFTARGETSDPRWSPDGSRLAFVANRGDHSFLGVYTNDSTAITWLAPAFARDRSPRWSPDGRHIAYVRLPGAGGAPDSLLPRRPNPWEIWTGDAATGAAQRLWKSPETLVGSVPSTDGGTNLGWGASDRVVFLSYQDGWPHLYSIPASGGAPLLLTPGRYMAEHISLSGDGRWLVFAGNMNGGDSLDIDRRHVIRVPVDRAAPQVMTPGSGLEWSPAVTGDGATLVFISATPQRPPLPASLPLGNSRAAIRPIAADRIPANFPTGLVTPRQVVFRSADGLTIHGQLFEAPGGGNTRKPAIVYVHGGPPRQMLLGWHYSDYYSNAYALNQYLASRGFIVLSVNYRLGIGYGYDFHQPPSSGARGAAEYRDIQAAAAYLRAQPRVDGARIGIYGGSYGGYLTALALARNSDMFAAGVDIHGVHDWSTYARGLDRQRYEQAPDVDTAVATAWHSSPVSSVAGWKSPVLLIHGDDDRNVRFSQSTDLVRRLAAAGVRFETLVIPDDTHHFLRYANILTVDKATAEFLERQLLQGSAAQTRATGRQ